MSDLFAGSSLSGGEPPTAALSDDEVTRLAEALEGAAVLGAELEPQFRVLAVTVEPTAERYAWAATADRRIQLLASPVSTFLVTLRREAEDGTRELLTFEQEQLVDVVAALDGPTITGPVIGLGEPRPGEWAPRFSLQGRSTAPNGTARTLRLELSAADLHLGIFGRFDDLELRDPAGQPLRLPS